MTTSNWNAHVEYFDRGARENEKFWDRLGGRPDLRGKKVLDLGCGHGSLCVDAARAGAARVVGIDLDHERIHFADSYVPEANPELRDIIEFRVCDIRALKEDDFDVILSKDALEHIVNLEQVVASIWNHLVPAGIFYAGFGPLYNSPYGDHRRTRLVLPWAHVFLRESLIVSYLKLLGHSDVNSIHDLGLNGLALKDYHRIFAASGLKTIQFRINVSGNPISKLFSLIRKRPALSEYFSHNIYAVLQKPANIR